MLALMGLGKKLHWLRMRKLAYVRSDEHIMHDSRSALLAVQTVHVSQHEIFTCHFTTLSIVSDVYAVHVSALCLRPCHPALSSGITALAVSGQTGRVL